VWSTPFRLLSRTLAPALYAIIRQPSTLSSMTQAVTMERRVGESRCHGDQGQRDDVFVVRNVFHCSLGKRQNVKSSSPPSRRLVTTPGQRFPHVRSKAV